MQTDSYMTKMMTIRDISSTMKMPENPLNKN